MTETNKREVNADSETLHLEDDPAEESKDTEEDDDLDEEVIAPLTDEDDEALKAESLKGKETEEAASAESSPEELESVEKTETVPSNKPAPVAGETAREKGLRLEVQRVKGLLRKKSVTDLVDNPRAEPGAASDAVTELKKLGYDDDEIKNMDKAVDLIASSRGYVKQSQTYQTVVNDEVGAFIKANPEYKPENDPEDVRWETFQRYLTGGLYNINGKTRDQLQTLFLKVKGDVDLELGESATETKSKDNESEERKTAAERQKIKSVSHSGGTKPASTKNKTPVDPEVRKMFKGFDDEDLE